MNAYSEIRDKFEKVLDKYGVCLVSMLINIQGTADITLSNNIYYKEQEKMMEELQAIFPLNDVEFEEIIY